MIVVAAAATEQVQRFGPVLAEQFTDPQNARVIYFAAGGLAVLALLIGIGTVLWWRSTEVEHPALGPLEVMGTRRWWKGDYAARRRHLDAARPATEPAEGDEAPAEPVDLQAIATATPTHFDDLLDDFDLAALSGGRVPATVSAAQAAAAAAVVDPADFSDPAIAEVAVAAAGPEDPTAAVSAPVPIDPLLRSTADE